MTTTTPSSASARITAEVTSWPGVHGQTGSRGEWSLRVGHRELGHLHGDRVAHFSFPKAIGAQLRGEGRVVDHPVFPGVPAMAARAIQSEDDERDVIALMRSNYERVRERTAQG